MLQAGDTKKTQQNVQETNVGATSESNQRSGNNRRDPPVMKSPFIINDGHVDDVSECLVLASSPSLYGLRLKIPDSAVSRTAGNTGGACSLEHGSLPRINIQGFSEASD
jgi:hypothetical protein